jgi:hypothetical protein
MRSHTASKLDTACHLPSSPRTALVDRGSTNEHAYATRLLEASVHPKVVSEALGHSSVSFTMDTYQHLMPTMQETATQAIEKALGAAIAGDE